MTKQYILYLEVDVFYASVEEILNPSFKGKPLIVSARPEQRGVVASASYAARAFGVRSAMPTAQALYLCHPATIWSGWSPFGGGPERQRPGVDTPTCYKKHWVV